MTRSEAELEKLYRRLTAKERAKLEIARWREDKEPDPLLRRLTPDWQVAEVNDYLLTAERANATIGAMVLWLGQRMETIEVRHALVAALRLRQMLADEVVMTLQLDLPEPITAAERDRRLAEQRLEPIPVREAAWLLTDHDLDDDELEKEQAMQEARIRKAAKRGELVVEWGKVRFGDLMDWVGREVEVMPEWGMEVQVMPDGSEEYVASVNCFRERVFAVVGLARAPSVGDAPDWNGIAQDIANGVAAGLQECWGILLAVEATAVNAAGAFDAEAVVHAGTLLELEEVRRRILRNVERLAVDGVGVGLPEEPDPDFLRTLKSRIE